MTFKDKQSLMLYTRLPRWLNCKESACQAGDLGLIPGSGRCSGEGNGNSTPVFLPGESHRQGSLMGYSPWGRKESDRTKRTRQQQQYYILFKTLDNAF